MLEVQGQRGVDVGGIRWGEAGHLDGGEVAVFFSPHADVAVARSRAARFPGQCSNVGLCSCSRIEAVDGGATRIVDEIWFGARDEVAQLIVSAPVSVDP